MPSMKAITIHQPWASLIAIGAERYETRSWKTVHRGYIAIHASQMWSKEQEFVWNKLRDMPETAHIPEIAPLGAIICVCELVNCIPVEQIRDQLSHDDKIWGRHEDGWYVWELRVMKILREPVPAPSKNGLWTWEYDLPSAKPKVFLAIAVTSFNDDARVCEVAVIHESGDVLLNTVVNPQVSIPPIASAHHSITDAVVRNAPTFSDLQGQIMDIFKMYDVHIYNAPYITRLLAQSGEGISPLEATCVMYQFAQVYGQWDDRYQRYVAQTLTKACEHYDIPNTHIYRAFWNAHHSRQVWLMMSKGVPS